MYVKKRISVVCLLPATVAKKLPKCRHLGAEESFQPRGYALRHPASIASFLVRRRDRRSISFLFGTKWNVFVCEGVLPNSTDKFRGVIVSSMDTTNNHRTLYYKPRLIGENRCSSSLREDDEPDEEKGQTNARIWSTICDGSEEACTYANIPHVWRE
ncbi:hypothetical protein TNCV_4153891 [Trichonephila clavipes]|nr:hypothetical protein TNCV_4153891 [Trichonephila clavipes]